MGKQIESNQYTQVGDMNLEDKYQYAAEVLRKEAIAIETAPQFTDSCKRITSSVAKTLMRRADELEQLSAPTDNANPPATH